MQASHGGICPMPPVASDTQCIYVSVFASEIMTIMDQKGIKTGGMSMGLHSVLIQGILCACVCMRVCGCFFYVSFPSRDPFK